MLTPLEGIRPRFWDIPIRATSQARTLASRCHGLVPADHPCPKLCVRMLHVDSCDMDGGANLLPPQSVQVAPIPAAKIVFSWLLTPIIFCTTLLFWLRLCTPQLHKQPQRQVVTIFVQTYCVQLKESVCHCLGLIYIPTNRHTVSRGVKTTKILIYRAFSPSWTIQSSIVVAH